MLLLTVKSYKTNEIIFKHVHFLFNDPYVMPLISNIWILYPVLITTNSMNI